MSNSLGFKQVLLFSTWILLVAVVSVTGYTAYRLQGTVTERLVNDSLAAALKKDAIFFRSVFVHRVEALDRFTEPYREQPIPSDPDTLIPLVRMLADLTNLDSAVIAVDSGEAYTNWPDIEGWPNHKHDGDVRTLPWFRFARQAEQPILSDPFADGGTTYISVVQAIANGAVTLDFDTGFMREMVLSVTQDSPGMMAAVLTENGYVLASSIEGLSVNGDLAAQPPFWQGYLQGVTGDSEKEIVFRDWGEDTLLASYRVPLVNRTFYLIVGIDKSVAFSHVDEVAGIALWTTLIVIVVASVLYYLLLQVTYRPLLSLKEVILSLGQGEGDLTRRLEVKGSDDLAQMGEGINEFIGQLQQMMVDVAAVAHRLKGQSTQLSGHSQRSAEILAGHAAETDQVLAAVEQMSVTAGNVAQDAGETAGYTREADELGQRCSGMTTEASNSLRALVGEVEQTATSVQSMTDETRSITQVLNVIGDIAEQTNLLALNAAIEAARAGEQGRGFAVVADEVRALASRTQSSTSEIAQALERLSGNNAKVVQAFGATKSSVVTVAENASTVVEGIDNLSQHLSQVTELSARIATSAEEQSSVTREISRNMVAIREMVTELDHSGDQAVQHSAEINEASQRLAAMVARFRL